MSGHHHRATLKQSNKSFKSKHASKGSLKAAAKGKPASASPSPSHAARNLAAISKKARLNANAQKRDAKRRTTFHDQKFFSTSSGGSGVPRIISVVPLLPAPSISPARFLRNLLPTLGLPNEEVEEISVEIQDVGTYLIRAPRFKTGLQINLLPPLSTYPTLDAALVSDYVILLLSSTDEVQLEGESVLRCLQAQAGGVEVVACVQDQPIAPANKQLIHKSLLSFSKYFFPSVPKVHSSDTPAEAALLARALCESAPSGGRDDARAYIVAEGSDSVRWTSDESTGGERGTLQVIGTVRGGKLSADRLVHIPGYGDFQLDSILPAPPSSLARAAKPHRVEMALDAPTEPIAVRGEEADDLTATNIPDPLANEQTWPTEEEMNDAPAAGPSEVKRTKRVPKGTSAYQAAWIFDDDDDEDDDEEEEEDDDEMDGDEEGDEVHEDDEEEEETEEVELDDGGRTSEPAHRDLDPEQEEREYEAYLAERERAQRDDKAFPDEIDTPRHVAARTRFQRYRGLKSFRTSPWDPYENLPVDYGKIFQFENFGATARRIERDARIADGARVGTRVIITIRDVPRSVLEEHDPRLAFIVHGLLQHEHKQSVLHFLIQRNTEFDEPVKAKDPLVLCVGPRRYTINPIFSAHARGGGKGVNNVHKSLKFLRQGEGVVMTTFGPVTFGKSPVIVLKSSTSDPALPSLVAMGTSLPPDPTRIIAKRIILTGHPFKIHKKTATIRFMFFERDDVDYFRSIELHTKYGRVGHITEALGTHGYFKAHFDGPIGQMDTICMNLYKRQFPKWSSDFSPEAKISEVTVEESAEMDVE